MAWTRETLSSLRRALDARVEDVPFWTDLEARLALNEALSFWNLLTGYWSQTVLLPTAPGDPFVGLPGSILFRTRVSYAGAPLAQSSLPDLFRGRPGWWQEVAGGPGDLPLAPRIWAPVSLSLIALWPQPATPALTALEVIGIARTPTLIAEDDPVDLEDGVLNHLLGYALHALTFKEGWARFAGTVPAMQAFLHAAGEANGQLTASAAYRQYLGLDRAKDLRPTRSHSRLAGSLAQAGGLSVPDGSPGQ